MPSRRQLLLAGGGVLLLAPRRYRQVLAAPAVVEVRMRSDPDGARVGFDPIGLKAAPGTIVRWVVEANVHTTTAYHPANGGHPLRIPEHAAPWDSDYLVEPGQTFEVMLTVEGVYDYFCTPHEMAGMVGRIIIGRPGVAGVHLPDRGVPPMAQAAFPSIEQIMAEGIVRLSGGNSHSPGYH
jgi:plastocyanin